MDRNAVRTAWLPVAVAGALGLTLAAGACLLATPQYAAESRTVISPGPGTPEGAAAADVTQREAETYSRLVTTALVLDPVIAGYDGDRDVGALAERVTSTAPRGASLVVVRVTDADPALAAELANRVGASLVDAVDRLADPPVGTSPRVRATVVQPATPPTRAAAPDIPQTLVVGLLAGLLLGAGLVLLRAARGTTVRGPDDVARATGRLPLAVLTGDPSGTVRTQVAPSGPRAAAFEQLRTALLLEDSAQRLRSLVVTSSVAGEGSSDTAATLAALLAGTGAQVLLVEADLRPPGGADPAPPAAKGLTTVITGQATLDAAVRRRGSSRRLHVLPAGPPTSDPARVLTTPTVAPLLRVLERRYDAVVVDAPPLLDPAGASALARAADGVLVVVGSGRVTTRQLARAVGDLGRAGARSVGCVLHREPVEEPAREAGVEALMALPAPGQPSRGSGRAGGPADAEPPPADGAPAPTGPQRVVRADRAGGRRST